MVGRCGRRRRVVGACYGVWFWRRSYLFFGSFDESKQQTNGFPNRASGSFEHGPHIKTCVLHFGTFCLLSVMYSVCLLCLLLYHVPAPHGAPFPVLHAQLSVIRPSEMPIDKEPECLSMIPNPRNLMRLHQMVGDFW
jgi:hypothetical protein